MLNKIKFQLNEFKEAYQAAYEIKTSLMIYPEVMYVAGVQVNYYPKMLKASGLNCIMIDTLKRIFVDDTFMRLSKSSQEALVMHELGHLTLGHLDNINVTNSLKRAVQSSFGKVQNIGIEADKFSYDNGFDMINALKELREDNYVKQYKNTIKEINNRISILERY